jgi:hypothetical protein
MIDFVLAIMKMLVYSLLVTLSFFGRPCDGGVGCCSCYVADDDDARITLVIVVVWKSRRVPTCWCLWILVACSCLNQT